MSAFKISVGAALVSLLACGAVFAKELQNIAALDVFRMLPPSIFENTNMPLTEQEKEALLERGFTADWVVVKVREDSVLVKSPGDETEAVTLRLFRAPDGGIAVLGAETADSCAAELWRYGAHGGLFPAFPPEDPKASEYFTQESPMPQGVTPTYRLCLVGELLEAVPLFWNDSGLAQVRPANRVVYAWNGTAFNKSVVALP